MRIIIAIRTFCSNVYARHLIVTQIIVIKIIVSLEQIRDETLMKLSQAYFALKKFIE